MFVGKMLATKCPRRHTVQMCMNVNYGTRLEFDQFYFCKNMKISKTMYLIIDECW